MKSLYEIVKCIRGDEDLLNALLPKDQKSPLHKLNRLLFSNIELNDKEAIRKIYGSNSPSNFSQVKSRLKDIYFKIISIQNNPLEGEHSRINEILNQLRVTLVSRILLNQKNNQLGISIAEKSLTQSIKYHITDNVLVLSKILIRHFSTSRYDPKRIKKYKLIHEKYLIISSWETIAENYYMDLQVMQLISHATPNSTFVTKAKKYVEDLEQIDNIQSNVFYFYRYKVKTAFLEYKRDYQAVLELCDEYLNTIKSPILKSNYAIHSINLRKVWALIQANRNEEAILISQKDMKGLPAGSMSWYFMGHYKLKAFLYQGDYRDAIELIKLMIEQNGFKKLGKSFQELCFTTLGYIHLIVDSEINSDTSRYKKILPDFKIGKFLNNIPVFSKDKRGINVSILLMHIAILLQRKDYDKIIDRIDSLNQYAYKYLRKDDTYRSNCMIKMVIQMTKADFNPIRTERYTRDLLKQLEQVKLAGSGENIETEIIPYEVLWSIMLKALNPSSQPAMKKVLK